LEKEEIRVGEKITVGEITLLPIIRTSVTCRNVSRGIVCSGSKNLVGIVVVSPKEKRAISINGEEVPVHQYMEQVPELKELL
jgi:hypothetical protein